MGRRLPRQNGLEMLMSEKTSLKAEVGEKPESRNFMNLEKPKNDIVNFVRFQFQKSMPGYSSTSCRFGKDVNTI